LLFILTTLAAGLLGPAGPRPAGANEAPVIDGNTATYSGNQQPDPITQNNTSIYTINVQNLTTNVGSPSTGTAISLTNTGADGSGANSQALSLTYTGGTNSLLGQNYGAYVNTTGGTGKSDGGAGGAGGTNNSGVVTGVTISTSGAIQVSGIGIGGFSYGGAGGVGKEESSGHATGGTGGAGGSVQITNNGPITTTSTGNSHGIYAQSLGGGGGTGGEADASGTQGGGGTGGAGGAGGSVTVTNNAAINTGTYLGAYGINAMSNGGSGGQGGEGKNGPQSNGGDGGNGGKGGAVTVNCNAAINTAGLALAINAASNGGDGGSGGGNSGNEGTSDNGTGGDGGGSGLVSVNVVPGITLTGGIAAASIAGSGGTGSEGKNYGGGGGNGGASGGVQVNCQGNIDLSTNICNINGIWAQSVSGAGGAGGNAAGSGESYGGDGGNGGAGAATTVNCSGSITISGDYLHGILAQSWGGAGGAGGNAGHNPGSAGLSGAGGDVTVKLGGSIQTVGLSSYGILAQSIGGNGGEGGWSLALGLSGYATETFTNNVSVAIGGPGGSGATGNLVQVTNSGAIYTSGNQASGIYAQSMAGNDQAGNVTVTLNDPSSTATPGNIIANGLGSSGIVAQSLGKNGSGTIDITINQPRANAGPVQGGHSGTVTNTDGTTTTYNAYGVLIMDGQNNTLTNHGALSTLDATNGTAVMVQASYGAPAWGDLTISNYGTITGSVNQGAAESTPMTNGSNLSLPTGHSTITFKNYAGSTYNAGPIINLGGGHPDQQRRFVPGHRAVDPHRQLHPDRHRHLPDHGQRGRQHRPVERLGDGPVGRHPAGAERHGPL
jgi:hypothetical protein